MDASFLARWNSDKPQRIAYAALFTAAMALSALRAADDAQCLSTAMRHPAWRLTLTTDAEPGATARAANAELPTVSDPRRRFRMICG